LNYPRDTNLVSEPRKFPAWIEAEDAEWVFAPALTILELERGLRVVDPWQG